MTETRLENRIWAEVDLAGIRRNLRAIRRRAESGVAVMAVLKANAYGLGAVKIARTLQAAGVDAVGVGDSYEAIELKEAGIGVPIYILGALAGCEIETVVARGIIPSIHSKEVVAVLDAEARRQKKSLPVNLLIDTGMGRLGVKPAEAMDVLCHILEAKNLRLEGLSTHFPSAACDPDFTSRQLADFHALLSKAAILGTRPLRIHAANSQAIFMRADAGFNVVRPGISLYGIDPGGIDVDAHGLRRILSVKTQIVFIKNVLPDTSISYNRNYITRGRTKIATLPVGYNDGFRYSLSGAVEVVIRGTRAPVVGLVTMDYIMVDVGHIPDVAVGDLVTIVGKDGSEEITVEQLAASAGTIPYEITCGLSRRVKRVYTDSGSGEGDEQLKLVYEPRTTIPDVVEEDTCAT